MPETIVLLEGGEACGKSTTAKWLCEEHGFHLIKLPTPGSAFEDVIFGRGERIEKPSLQQKAICAMMDFANQMQLAITKHDRIVLDRGPLSTFAYQSPADAVKAVAVTEATKYIDAITHVIILDVDVEVGLAREEVKNEVSAAGLEFHKKVNQRYRDMSVPMQTILRHRLADDIIGCERGTLNAAEYLVRSMERASKEWVECYDLVAWKWKSLKDFLFLDTNPDKLTWNQVRKAVEDSIGLA